MGIEFPLPRPWLKYKVLNGSDKYVALEFLFAKTIWLSRPLNNILAALTFTQVAFRFKM